MKFIDKNEQPETFANWKGLENEEELLASPDFSLTLFGPYLTKKSSVWANSP